MTYNDITNWHGRDGSEMKRDEEHEGEGEALSHYCADLNADTNAIENTELTESDSVSMLSKQRGDMAAPLFLRPEFSKIEAAVRLAEGLHRNAGGTSSLEQFAKIAGNSPKSSYFNLKLNAMKAYGLVTVKNEHVTITTLGESIVAPKDASEFEAAKIEALKTFPLFTSLTDRYRGKGEPDAHFVANAFMTEVRVKADVAPAWAECFIRSAIYAGLFVAKAQKFEKVSENNIPPISKGNPPSDSLATPLSEIPEDWLTYPVRVPGGLARIIVPPNLTHGVWEKMRRLLDAIEPEKDPENHRG